MELFVLLSFVGTLVLIAAQAVEYAIESVGRPVRAARAAMPDNEVPTGDEPAPWAIAEQFDRAA